MNPIVYREELSVRFADLDPYGHVNSTHYLDYVVTSRFMFAEKRFGLDQEKFLQRGIGFYVSRVEIDFRRPIPGVQRIVVSSHVTDIVGTGAAAQFEIRSADERVLHAAGKFQFAFVDLQTKRPVDCPDWVRALFVEEEVARGAVA